MGIDCGGWGKRDPTLTAHLDPPTPDADLGSPTLQPPLNAKLRCVDDPHLHMSNGSVARGKGLYVDSASSSRYASMTEA